MLRLTSRYIYLFIFLFSIKSYAQVSLKREMRGVWIATVQNIDFPLKPTTDVNLLKQQWLDIIEKHRSMGINALYVQIRPESDAFYKSSIVPWSSYLTGQAGVGLANDYDILPFMIRTTHERGMEFHAWLNPYRVTMSSTLVETLPSNHVLKTHPEWCIFYDKKYFLNPGLPPVRSYIKDIVSEVVSKYDIDAIHFDDYFYPEHNGSETLNDSSTYEIYRGNFTNIEDWRRNNVDLLISELSYTIKRLKPRVQFGISPCGVWRNSDRDPSGSATLGLTSYDDLYADIRKWLHEGWIDYVVPQVYWTLGFQKAEFEHLVRWWGANSGGKPVYIGHGAYKVGRPTEREPLWTNPSEIPNQIQIARTIPNVKGSVFFSSKSLLENPLGITDSLKFNYYRYLALTPEVIKDTTALRCDQPEVRAITSESNGQFTVKWKPSIRAKKNQTFQYLVYRFPIGKVDFSDGRYIIAILPHNIPQNQIHGFDSQGNDTNLYSVVASDCFENINHSPSLADISNMSVAALSYNTKSINSSSVISQRKRVGWAKSFWRRVFGR